MWYNFDVQKFGLQMLPPILRRKLMLAFLKVLLLPLTWLTQQLGILRKETREHLSSSGQSLSLIEALRRTYNLRDGDAYITDAEDRQIYCYIKEEEQKSLNLYPSSDTSPPITLIYSDEGKSTPDFYIHIPDFLKKESEGIIRLIEQYKPAGRKYQIIYYLYE